jgi:hypothetical protein
MKLKAASSAESLAIFPFALVVATCAFLSGCSFFSKSPASGAPSAPVVAIDKTKSTPAPVGGTITTPHGYHVQVGVDVNQQSAQAKKKSKDK